MASSQSDQGESDSGQPARSTRRHQLLEPTTDGAHRATSGGSSFAVCGCRHPDGPHHRVRHRSHRCEHQGMAQDGQEPVLLTRRCLPTPRNRSTWTCRACCLRAVGGRQLLYQFEEPVPAPRNLDEPAHPVQQLQIVAASHVALDEHAEQHLLIELLQVIQISRHWIHDVRPFCTTSDVMRVCTAVHPTWLPNMARAEPSRMSSGRRRRPAAFCFASGRTVMPDSATSDCTIQEQPKQGAVSVAPAEAK